MQHQPPRITYDQGVHIDGTILWFDPTRVREFAAISHAGVPLKDRQGKILWGDRTARIATLLRSKKRRGLVCPFGRPFSIGNLELELFPSGFAAGASQFQVTFADGHKLVYAGPVSLRRNRTAEPIEIRRCDTLALDATYGHEQFVFPEREPIQAALLDWVRTRHSGGETPILLVQNPGHAQDLVHLLAGADFRVRVHRSVYACNRAYLGLGLDMPGCRQFRGSPPPNEVVVWPLHLWRSKAIRKVRKGRLAAVTGTGDARATRRRLRVADLFNWSCRADCADLQEFVRRVKPKRLLLTGAHAASFAASLSPSKMVIETLETGPQLPLL